MNRIVSVFIFVGDRPVHIPPIEGVDCYGMHDSAPAPVEEIVERASILLKKVGESVVKVQADTEPKEVT